MKYEDGNHILRSPVPWLPIFSRGSVPGGGGVTLPAANSAVLYPIFVPTIFKTDKFVIYINSSVGNIDLGIYDKNGNKIVSLGSTASPGSGRREFSFSQVTLVPNMNPYYLAFAADNNIGLTVGKYCFGDIFANFRFNSSFPLPATLNLAAPTARDGAQYGILLQNAEGPTV